MYTSAWAACMHAESLAGTAEVQLRAAASPRTVAGACAITTRGAGAVSCTLPMLPAGAYTLVLRDGQGAMSVDPYKAGAQRAVVRYALSVLCFCSAVWRVGEASLSLYPHIP